LGGFESTRSSTWFDAPSRFWSVGPSATVPLLDAGARYGLNKQARAQYDQAAAAYRKTTLTAYQEVEDNLAALRQLQQESVSQAAAVTATGKALQQANHRYKGGLVTYLEVASTENTALQAQLSAVAIQLRRLHASVLLVKALGGGWQSEKTGQSDMAAQ
jgi:outer membrane protein TolC